VAEGDEMVTTEAKMCYCRRKTHIKGAVEKCIAAPSWNALKLANERLEAQAPALAELVRAARAAVADCPIHGTGKGDKCYDKRGHGPIARALEPFTEVADA
jgi:hypothetical protein